jgi:glutaredoxin
VTGRRAFLALLAAMVLFLAGPVAGPAAGQDRTVELHLFWLSTCPHCAAAREYLGALSDDVPELDIREHEVSSDPEAQRLFAEMTEARGGEPSAVPTIIIGERMWVGFDDTIAAEVRAEVEALAATGTGAGDDGDDSSYVDVPFVGAFDVGSSSLLLSTIAIGFVDGVNPCSLWVLSILLGLVLHSGSRRRVALVGTVFLFVTTLLYGLYVVGAYSLLSYASYLSWIQRLVAAVVGVFGVVNLRDYFRASPATLAIPASAKPGIYRRARSLIAPDRSLFAVVGGTAVLAAGVSLVETPCSAALPLLWTDLLASHDVSVGVAVALFAIYMLIFLVDELVLFGAVVVTMRATHLQEQHGRLLRLVTGSVMLCLAAAMLIDPGLMSEMGGTLAVLASMVVVAVVLAAIGQWTHRRPLRHA